MIAATHFLALFLLFSLLLLAFSKDGKKKRKGDGAFFSLLLRCPSFGQFRIHIFFLPDFCYCFSLSLTPSIR